MSINGRGGITSKSGRERPSGGFLGPLRAVALIALLPGAAGSLGLMLRVGRHNNSRILIALFTIWVLAPFAALVFANVVSRSWPVLTRVALYGVTLVITLGSLAIYGVVAFGPPRPKPAFAFLVVPLVSWLLIVIVVRAAAFISGRLSRHSGAA